MASFISITGYARKGVLKRLPGTMMDESVDMDGSDNCGGVVSVEPLDAVTAVVDEAGVSGRRLREIVADLTEAPRPLEDLIRRSALPRRSVEAILRAAGEDVEEGPRGFAIRSDRVAAYRERFGSAQLGSTRLDDVVGRRLSESGGLVARIESDIASAPASKSALDHVSATAQTVARRALWLDGMFDLAGRHVLCIGDHDLTSLALCAVNPEVTVTVADIDERILEFIDCTAKQRGLQVRCLYADFRFGLPEDAVGWADVVLTDPPYTPEGVQLFLGRGLQGLRDRTGGRLVMAYGFSERAAALGVKAQRAVLDLELALEAILPRFNRYHGAQAVGSASDLYVCQPTARTWKVLDRRLEQAATNIYTHGEQSLEGQRKQPTDTDAEALRRVAVGDTGETASVIAVNGPRRGGRNLDFGNLLAEGLSPQWLKQRPVMVTADLSADPGPWLLRCLLATNADRMAILVPNVHADLANEAGQRALRELIAPKYSLRFHRSNPNPRTAIVEAVAVEPDGLDAGARLARRVLDRVHGKTGNVWRDGLISLSRVNEAALTKNEARALVQESTVRPEFLSTRVIDLPRHMLHDLLVEVATSAKRVG